ncbi:hypothetical protein STABA_v1c10630 [Spiroplasma tabanidicola]|uniref:Transmembrane protein n=2 Tax=Spiroplasma tabanidicola TaxID=324079 RepID=A0A6I6CBQ1_9MOLU|nr:hypothetical protein STABA_v1c10630 [Spiroplasma tabanidicola]
MSKSLGKFAWAWVGLNGVLLLCAIISLSVIDFKNGPEFTIFQLKFTDICLVIILVNVPYLLGLVKESSFESYSIYVCIILFFYEVFILTTQILFALNIFKFKNKKLHKILSYLSILHIFVLTDLLFPIIVFCHKYVIYTLNKDAVYMKKYNQAQKPKDDSEDRFEKFKKTIEDNKDE